MKNIVLVIIIILFIVSCKEKEDFVEKNPLAHFIVDTSYVEVSSLINNSDYSLPTQDEKNSSLLYYVKKSEIDNSKDKKFQNFFYILDLTYGGKIFSMASFDSLKSYLKSKIDSNRVFLSDWKNIEGIIIDIEKDGTTQKVCLGMLSEFQSQISFLYVETTVLDGSASKTQLDLRIESMVYRDSKVYNLVHVSQYQKISDLFNLVSENLKMIQLLCFSDISN